MGTRLEAPLQCSEVAGEAFLAPWQQRGATLLSSTAHCAPPRLWNVGRSSCPIPPHHRRLPATTTLTRARSAAPAAAPLRSPPLQWRAPHKNWRSSESTRTMGGLVRCGHRDLSAPHKNWRSSESTRTMGGLARCGHRDLRAPHKNWRSSESTRTMGGLARCGHRDFSNRVHQAAEHDQFAEKKETSDSQSRATAVRAHLQVFSTREPLCMLFEKISMVLSDVCRCFTTTNLQLKTHSA